MHSKSWIKSKCSQRVAQNKIKYRKRILFLKCFFFTEKSSKAIKRKFCLSIFSLFKRLFWFSPYPTILNNFLRPPPLLSNTRLPHFRKAKTFFIISSKIKHLCHQLFCRQCRCSNFFLAYIGIEYCFHSSVCAPARVLFLVQFKWAILGQF